MSRQRNACLFIYLFTHGGGERPIQYQRPGKHDPLNQRWFNVGPA